MEEVSGIKKELERTIPSNDGKRALELLRSLESIPMSIDILQTTHIGLTVNKIRKEIANSEVGSLSKSMVKKWKKLVAPSSGSDGGGGGTRGGSSNNNSNSASVNSHTGANSTNTDSRSNNNNGNSTGQAGTNQTSSAAASLSSSTTGSAGNSATSAGPANPSSDSASISRQTPINISSQKESSSQSHSASSYSRSGDTRLAPLQTEVPSTSCEVRLKFRQMLTRELKKPLPEELRSEAFLEEEILAGRIEECVYQEYRSIDTKYKNRLRSKLSNLGDSKNPFLRYKVLRGDITPDRFAKMSAEEMASDDLKKERERYTKESINDHQMSLTTGTRTSEIKCPACKKCDVTYNQMQTRSADEPMTTFCHCNECGKRWKFC